MIQTILAIVVLLGAVLWLPVWVQIVFFILATVVVRHRLLLLVPAIVADVMYAPNPSFAIEHFIMTGIVLGMLLVWYVVVHQTRLGESAQDLYVSIKK
ncbi:MAG: hypothetical protein KBB91_02450 [Candidatus Pacebacteria bacterium]|jgi:hypothetical protein|nr:hypothetical protein [Candidatus Paceibacterota bacterium]